MKAYSEREVRSRGSSIRQRQVDPSDISSDESIPEYAAEPTKLEVMHIPNTSPSKPEAIPIDSPSESPKPETKPQSPVVSSEPEVTSVEPLNQKIILTYSSKPEVTSSNNSPVPEVIPLIITQSPVQSPKPDRTSIAQEAMLTGFVFQIIFQDLRFWVVGRSLIYINRARYVYTVCTLYISIMIVVFIEQIIINCTG